MKMIWLLKHLNGKITSLKPRFMMKDYIPLIRSYNLKYIRNFILTKQEEVRMTPEMKICQQLMVLLECRKISIRVKWMLLYNFYLLWNQWETTINWNHGGTFIIKLSTMKRNTPDYFQDFTKPSSSAKSVPRKWLLQWIPNRFLSCSPISEMINLYQVQKIMHTNLLLISSSS